MKVVLGSASGARKRVLQKMGYDFEVMTADIDERAIRYSDPRRLVLALAHAKASAILPEVKRQRGVLITSDQVVFCGGRILEKPVDRGEVKSFFGSYRIHPAETVTGVVVTDLFSRVRVWGVDRVKILFRYIPPDIVDLYADSGDPYNHAGGFDHDHVIINPYVEDIEGERESVSGLPRTLTQELMQVFYK